MSAGFDDFLTSLRAQMVRTASPKPWHVRPKVALAFIAGVLAPAAVVAAAIVLSSGTGTQSEPVVNDVGASVATAYVLPVAGETPITAGSAPQASYSLTAVAARAATDVWTVGARRSGGSSEGDSFVLHFDGDAWRESDTPDVGPLDAVAVTPTGEVWTLSSGSGAILRRTGEWSRADAGIPTGTTIETIAATSSGAVWVAGSRFGEAFVARWDGSSWVEAALPQPTPRGSLSSLSATPAGDVWAVGADPIGRRGLVLRSDGTAWSLIAGEDGTVDGWPAVDTVAAVSPADAWIAAGDLLHWDGSAWTGAGESFAAGRSAAAVAPDDVWLSSGDRLSLAHWDGDSWSVCGMADMGFDAGDDVEIAGVAACPGGLVWAVGTAADRSPVVALHGADGWRVSVDSVVTEGDR